METKSIVVNLKTFRPLYYCNIRLLRSYLLLNFGPEEPELLDNVDKNLQGFSQGISEIKCIPTIYLQIWFNNRRVKERKLMGKKKEKEKR